MAAQVPDAHPADCERRGGEGRGVGGLRVGQCGERCCAGARHPHDGRHRDLQPLRCRPGALDDESAYPADGAGVAVLLKHSPRLCPRTGEGCKNRGDAQEDQNHNPCHGGVTSWPRGPGPQLPNAVLAPQPTRPPGQGFLLPTKRHP
eukprot:2207737-Pyramimonas_sp.AAC.1